MVQDLSARHEPVSELFWRPQSAEQWEQYRLTPEQIEFYHEYGYLAGVRLLSDQQVDALRQELAGLTDPAHPGNSLFYEYNSNESVDPERSVVSCPGSVADHRRLSRLTVEPGLYHGG